jgi:TatD DNase family protein
MIPLVDSHCHLDALADPTGAISRAERAGVIVVAVTEAPTAFQSLRVRLGSHRVVRPALGAHPLAAHRLSTFELMLFDREIERTDYVGEVGLDRSTAGRETYGEQRRVFESVLAHPKITRKVLTVHSRGAEADAITLLERAKAKAILHWYSGPERLIERALSAGLYFSINQRMLMTRNGRRLIAALPSERLLTETDAPYARARGSIGEPRDVRQIIRGIAALRRCAEVELEQMVFDNMRRLHASAVAAGPVGAAAESDVQAI